MRTIVLGTEFRSSCFQVWDSSFCCATSKAMISPWNSNSCLFSHWPLLEFMKTENSILLLPNCGPVTISFPVLFSLTVGVRGALAWFCRWSGVDWRDNLISDRDENNEKDTTVLLSHPWSFSWFLWVGPELEPGALCMKRHIPRGVSCFFNFN